MVRRALILLLLAVIPAFFTGWLHPRRPVWREVFNPIPVITLAQLAARPVVTTLWIDAREAASYAQGHYPGALNLNETSWEASLPAVLDAWSPEHLVIVYCGGGGCQASREVAERLRRELALTRLVILADGWPTKTPTGVRSRHDTSSSFGVGPRWSASRSARLCGRG